MKIFYSILTFLILFLLTGCADKPTETSTLGSVYGTVFDQSNNSELSGATVSIQNVGNRTTDNNGYYEFLDLEENIYSINAEKAGYVTETTQVEIEANTNKEVNFTLHTAQPAQLLVSPTNLNFGQTVYDLNITVNNGGDEELSWQIISGQSWLTIFPSTGTTTTEEDQITVTVNRSGLEVGNYSGNLTFTSNGGNINVPVQMEITPIVLIIDPNSLNFGSEETNLSFTISNTGNGELNWSLIPNQNWITANPTSGSLINNSEDVLVTVNRSGLTPDTYNGSISLTSNGGNQDINITMVVPEGPAPLLEVNPISLDFGTTTSQSSFEIQNAGETTLNWNISDNQDWLNIYPTGGSTNPSGTTTINVSVDRTGLSFGSYNGIINITSNGGNETVSVSMNVPFLETFENLNNWTNDGWTISTDEYGDSPPSAKHYWFDSQTSIMSINVNVTDGQILSFYRYAAQQSTVLELYFNNILVWNNTQYWYGAGNHSIPITGTGSLNIKFIGIGGCVYIDDVTIE